MHMQLRHLRHLVALADEGRFVAAAERVHLSQAAFSRSIQALESELDLRLFDRGPQGAVLTPAGRVIAERARQLLFDSRCLERDVALLREGDLGDVSFGAGPFPAATLVAPLLASLHREAPGLVMHVRSGNVASLLTLLHAESIDFFLADPRLAAPDARLETAPIAQLEGAFYVRARHPLARQRVVRPADLQRYGVASVFTPLELRDALARGLGFDGATGFPLRAECDDLPTLLHLAQHSDLAVVLPHALVAASARSLKALTLAGAAPPLYADVQAVWLRGRTRSPAAQRAIDLARQVAATLPGAAVIAGLRGGGATAGSAT